MRQHPNSGAGRMKYDMSDDDTLLEMKDANKSFTISAAYVEDLFRVATRQGKQAVLVIKFGNDIIIEAVVRKERL